MSSEQKLRGLNTVRISKDELIERLKENRAKHRAEFEEGIEAYRAAVIKELEDQLERALKGQDIQRFSLLQQPEDHTSDYDHALDLLEMSLDEEIELTADDFARYVRDDWGWKKQFASSIQTSNNYLASGEYK